MCIYIIENIKLKMFSLMTPGGHGWFDTMLWVICKHFASHEPIKSIVYSQRALHVGTTSTFSYEQHHDLISTTFQCFSNVRCQLSYNFVMLVRVCVSNAVCLQRLLQWFYQEFDNFQRSAWDVVIKHHFITSGSYHRNLWLYHISYFSKKNVPSF